jgi:hypothetical protein
VLKFLFWVLLCLNGILFAYDRGYLGTFKGNEREPARMRNQLAADKLTLVPPAQPQPGTSAAPAPAEAATPVEPAMAGPGLACTELGPFAPGEARRFETRLERFDLGERQSRVTVPFQEVTSRLVHIPPLGSKEAAERKVAELRGLGVNNLFIISADSPLKWGISLGLFKSETAAQAMLASLNKQGVRGARIAVRGPMGTRTAYRFRDIDAQTRARLIGIAERVGPAQVRSCK